MSKTLPRLEDVMPAMGLHSSSVQPIHTQHKLRRLVDRRAKTIVVDIVVPVYNEEKDLESGIAKRVDGGARKDTQESRSS
jgi:hypothetical protein